MRACSHIAECSLSYVKIMQTSAMRVCSHIAECSLSYVKIMQTSAMRVCSHIAECSLSYVKINGGSAISSTVKLRFNVLQPHPPWIIIVKNK